MSIKSLLLTRSTFFAAILLLVNASGCQYLEELREEIKPRQPQVSTLANGLVAPLGLEADSKGQLWVTEAGTGTANDGRLSLITPQGRVYPVVEGFASAVSPEGGVFGLNHLLLKDNVLYMTHGTEGRLYKFDVTSFTPGEAPLQAKDLDYEDIGSFVKAYDFEEDTGESDLFNLAVGPEGDLYLLDAGANAILHRQASGELSVFATIPPVKTTLPDFPFVEAVPTGIVFDGKQFLVSTFTGFPFPPKQAVIYAVDLAGNTTIYQSGLTSLTDIELGIDHRPVVLEYGTWTGEGFAENSGQILQSTGKRNTPLFTKLNFPNSLERKGLNTFYVAQTFEGTIQMISF